VAITSVLPRESPHAHGDAVHLVDFVRDPTILEMGDRATVIDGVNLMIV
jgi:hypothetical protein